MGIRNSIAVWHLTADPDIRRVKQASQNTPVWFFMTCMLEASLTLHTLNEDFISPATSHNTLGWEQYQGTYSCGLEARVKEMSRLIPTRGAPSWPTTKRKWLAYVTTTWHIHACVTSTRQASIWEYVSYLPLAPWYIHASINCPTCLSRVQWYRTLSSDHNTLKRNPSARNEKKEWNQVGSTHLAHVLVRVKHHHMIRWLLFAIRWFLFTIKLHEKVSVAKGMDD